MSLEKSPNALKTIGEVAEDIDVATHVLRFWESKFHQIKPQKRRGRRYYRPEDVVIITQIKALLYGQGYTIRGVQKFLSTEFKMKEADNKNAPPVADAQDEAKKVLNVAPNAVPFAIQMPQAAQPASPFSVLRPVPSLTPNIFPASPANNPVSVNQNSPVSVVAPKEAVTNANEESRIANEDVEKLKQIYDGMCNIREQLKETI
jgi:DNA-binding transcriptional MerR regulator